MKAPVEPPRLLADPDLAAGLARAGRRHIVDNFSYDVMLEVTARLYLELIQRTKDGTR